MLKLDTESLPTQKRAVIQTSPTFSALDVSQERIKQYLSERCAEKGATALKTGDSDVLIDIDVLAVRKADPYEPKDWGHGSVYPIRIYHSTVLLGPLYDVTGERGPCPHCLELRWLSLRPREEQEAINTLQGTLIFGANPRLLPSPLEMIWSVVEEALYQSDSSTYSTRDGSIYSLNLDSLSLTHHELIADSSCPVCAHPGLDTPEAAVVQLSSRIKRDAQDYRLVKPHAYQLPEAAYVNPACGMLGAEAISDRFHTVTAPVSGKLFMRRNNKLYDVWWGGHTTNFHTSWKVGLLEGLERYAGHWARARKISVVDSYENLAADALDPRTCGLYHPDFYKQRPYYNAFSVDRQLSWVWGYSFQQQRPILVPEILAYYGTGTKGPFVFGNSSGCAIGSCMEEAIFFGLLELIERDNFVLCWYAKLAPPRIDPWSSRNVTTLRLLDRIDKLGYDVHFLDTRLDTHIPTITALVVNRKNELGKLVLAAGVSLDPEDAIRGALCEVSAYVASISGWVQSKLEQTRATAQDFSKVIMLEQHPLLYGLPEMAQHTEFLLQNPRVSSVEEAYRTYLAERPPSHDLRDDLQYTIDRILKLGMDVVVVDQSYPEIEGTGLKVARVIVPGLLHIDFGWEMQRVHGLPRLQTVPRTAGFLEKDFDVSLLNTVPHPFP